MVVFLLTVVSFYPVLHRGTKLAARNDLRGQILGMLGDSGTDNHLKGQRRGLRVGIEGTVRM